MKLADRQLRDTSIRAPFDGYVEKRLVTLGELVKAQTPVMSVVRIDPLKVIGGDSREDGAVDQDGQPVELHVDAYPDRAFTGKVSRISPAVNTATRAFPFEALVPNPEAALKPGTFARVHIETAKEDEVLTLPYASLQYRYGVNRVFVVDGDKLAVRELKVGDRLGDRIEVARAASRPANGWPPTDVDKLADGMKVKASTNANGVSRCSPNSASAAPSSRRCSSCRSWCSASSRSAISASISSRAPIRRPSTSRCRCPARARTRCRRR